MKVIVNEMPKKASDCLFCEKEESMTNCMFETKFMSSKEYRGRCSCILDNGGKCPYLDEANGAL